MMPFKSKTSIEATNDNNKSDKDSTTVTIVESKISSPASSKSPMGSKSPSQFSTSSESPKASQKAPGIVNLEASQDIQSTTSKDGIQAVDSNKDETVNRQELKSGKDIELSDKDKHKTVSRQLLLSPKRESNSGRKKNSSKSKNKSKKEETSKQQTITEHFVVRRSQRKCKSKIEEEKRKSTETSILEGREDGLEVREVEGKGRGVFALKTFERGDLVVEYAGDLIDINTAKEREKKYSENKDIGCYMYYFTFGNKKYCVDATEESGRLGRLLNHSVNGNCTTKVISIKDNPCLILVAAKHINPGEELLYDYGERDKGAIASHPWLQL